MEVNVGDADGVLAGPEVEVGLDVDVPGAVGGRDSLEVERGVDGDVGDASFLRASIRASILRIKS